MFSGTIEKALLEFFSATTVSSAIMETLAEAANPMSMEEILLRVKEKRSLDIPMSAVESSIVILVNAGLLASSKKTYRLSDLGKELLDKLIILRKPPAK